MNEPFLWTLLLENIGTFCIVQAGLQGAVIPCQIKRGPSIVYIQADYTLRSLSYHPN